MFQACKPALLYAFIGVVNLLLFSTYTLTTGNPLTPAIVFTTISLMSNVRLTATGFILNGVVGFQEAKIAFSRIQVSAQFAYHWTFAWVQEDFYHQCVKHPNSTCSYHSRHSDGSVSSACVRLLNHIFIYIGLARWDNLNCGGGGGEWGISGKVDLMLVGHKE